MKNKTKQKLNFPLQDAYVNHGIWVRHHGNKQIQQDNHIDDTVRAKHKQTPEASVGLDAC